MMVRWVRDEKSIWQGKITWSDSRHSAEVRRASSLTTFCLFTRLVWDQIWENWDGNLKSKRRKHLGVVGEKVLWEIGTEGLPLLQRYWVGTLESSHEKAGWTARLMKRPSSAVTAAAPSHTYRIWMHTQVCKLGFHFDSYMALWVFSRCEHVSWFTVHAQKLYCLFSLIISDKHYYLLFTRNNSGYS